MRYQVRMINYIVAKQSESTDNKGNSDDNDKKSNNKDKK